MGRQPRHARALGAKIMTPPGGARPRVLKAKWTMNSAQELRDLWGSSGARWEEVANVEIQIGVPPLVHSWLLLNCVEYTRMFKKPLQRARYLGRSYYVLPIKHGAIYDIGTLGIAVRSPVVRNTPTSTVSAVVAWLESIDPVLCLIKQMDDVVSLASWCAKLVVAPEKKNCAWRKRKT